MSAEESVKHQKHLAGIPNGLILVVVVEQRMKLSGLASELPHPRHPLLQFVVRVEIIESLLDSDSFLLPGCIISTVETEDGNIRRGFDYRRDRGLEPWGSSTQTKGKLLSRRNSMVRCWFFSFSHELCRNSTAILYWGSFSLQDRM